MKRRILVNLTLGIVTYLVFLIATLPAATAYGWFAHDLPALRMGGLEGTVWAGHAAGVNYRGRSLGAADWDVHAWRLLLGHLGAGVRLSAGSDSVSGFASLSIGGNLHARDVDAAVSLNRLGPFFSIPAGMANGQVTAHLKNLEIPRSGPISVQGRIVLSELSVSFPQALTLGDYAAELDSDKGALRARIHDASGPLDVQLIATLNRNGAYLVTGTLGARSSAPSSLKSALDVLGKPGPDGRHRLNLSGSLQGIRF